MQLLRSPEGRNMFLAGILTLIWAFLLVAIVDQMVGVFTNTMIFTLTGLGVAVLGFLFFRSLTRRYRKRLSARFKAFPPAWEESFSKTIPDSPEEQVIDALQKQVLVFLAEKPQTAVGQKPPETLRVSLATAMRWPIRNYPQWDYPELLEVLWYNFSFCQEPANYHKLTNRLRDILDEDPLISVLPISVVDISTLVTDPSKCDLFLSFMGVDTMEIPQSVTQSPLQLIALSYIQNVMQYGHQRGLLSKSIQLSWTDLMQLADDGFYGDKKSLIQNNRKAAEVMSFVFQDGRMGWRRAMADLAWQRPGILGPKAPQIDEFR